MSSHHQLQDKQATAALSTERRAVRANSLRLLNDVHNADCEYDEKQHKPRDKQWSVFGMQSATEASQGDSTYAGKREAKPNVLDGWTHFEWRTSNCLQHTGRG
jgi:hypothetical protein